MAGDHREIAIDVDVHRAIERARRSLGESENEILRRLLIAASGGARSPRGSAAPARRGPGEPRRRGLWTVEIGGRQIEAANLKHAYRSLLRALAESHPHFLETFASETARGRRFVARSAEGLYDRSPHLAGRHGEPLVEGWFFDSNLSAEQVSRRARIAARLCGLFYGPDVRILDNMREI